MNVSNVGCDLANVIYLKYDAREAAGFDFQESVSHGSEEQ